MAGEALSDVGREVLARNWRRSPVVFRSVLDNKDLASFSRERYLNWTDRTRRSVRIFESFGDGTSRSGLFQNANSVRSTVNSLISKEALFTLHMNGVELVDTDVFSLRKSLEIPYWWRLDDVIATLSTRASGIGYHAGHEDGFIVQLLGARRWKVWSDTHTPFDYRKELLCPSEGPNPLIRRPEDHEKALLDVELQAGDILYVPPFFPHEGVTLDTSISLSIAWKGLAPASFVPPGILNNVIESRSVFDRERLVQLFREHDCASDAIEDWRRCTIAFMERMPAHEARSIVEHEITKHFAALEASYVSAS